MADKFSNAVPYPTMEKIPSESELAALPVYTLSVTAMKAQMDPTEGTYTLSRKAILLQDIIRLD